MNLALDTNRYSDFARGLPDVVKHVAGAARVYLPRPVVAELRCGFVLGNRAAENEQALTRFLAQPTVSVLRADESTTNHYAVTYLHLRRQGTPIPINDLWIAALCIQHGLTLYARDAHFSLIPNLQLV